MQHFPERPNSINRNDPIHLLIIQRNPGFRSNVHATDFNIETYVEMPLEQFAQKWRSRVGFSDVSERKGSLAEQFRYIIGSI